MKNNITLVIIGLLLTFGMNSYSQTIFGKWKTFDEETGKEKSIVEIFEKDRKAYAKILQILEKEKKINFVKIAVVQKKTNLLKGWKLLMV